VLALIAAIEFGALVMTIVGLGALIFFHELGHFLACRVTGTRVEAFSIGFGKEIFGWTRGHTRYRVGIIPLGGYVKMAAENPGEKGTGAPDEFPNKSFGQRLLIMSAGVIFNVILAFVLFVLAFAIGVPFEKAQVGGVVPGGPAWQAGLLPGDVVKAVDGRPVIGFNDLQMEVAFAADEAVDFTVLRGGKTLHVPVVPAYSDTRGYAEIGISPAVDPAAHGVVADSPVARAGGRPGDTILAIEGRPFDPSDPFSDVAQQTAGLAPAGQESLTLRYTVRHRDGQVAELPVTLPLDGGPQIGVTPWQGRVIDKVVRESPFGTALLPGDSLVTVNGHEIADFIDLRDLGPEPLKELVVERDGARITVSVPAGATVATLLDSVTGKPISDEAVIAPRPGMPAERAGVRAGDKVVSAGGQPVSSFVDLHRIIGDNGLAPLDLEVRRGEETVKLTIQPARKAGPDGYQWGLLYLPYRETGVLDSLAMGWRRTTLSIRTVLVTIRGLVTAKVSHKSIGGPLTLGQVTYQMFDQGWGRYLYILALISVNLAILNILPIPVLDGGQIVLLCAEKVRGKPLPERVVGYYQLVGLVLILGILFIAFKNDVGRLLQ